MSRSGSDPANTDGDGNSNTATATEGKETLTSVAASKITATTYYNYKRIYLLHTYNNSYYILLRGHYILYRTAHYYLSLHITAGKSAIGRTTTAVFSVVFLPEQTNHFFA